MTFLTPLNFLNLIYLLMTQTSVFSSKNLDYLQSVVNQELSVISEWLKANRLALNIDKTNFVIFNSLKNKPYKPVVLKIEDNAIKQKQSIKYLGILIDSNLSWKPHINELSKKLSRTIGILYKICFFANTKILLMLYFSLFHSILIYGIQAWGLTYNTSLKPL